MRFITLHFIQQQERKLQERCAVTNIDRAFIKMTGFSTAWNDLG
jgi:hypothetical protein